MSFSEQIKNEILSNIKGSKEISYLEAERFGELLTQVSTKTELKEKYTNFFDISKLDEIEIKEILKGIFLSSGCVVDPSLDYHLEIYFKNKSCTEYVYDILSLSLIHI